MNKPNHLKLESLEELDALCTGDIIKGSLTFYGETKRGIESIYVYYEGYKMKELLIQANFTNDISSYKLEKRIIIEIRNGAILHAVSFEKKELGPKHYLYEPRQKILEEKDLWRNR